MKELVQTYQVLSDFVVRIPLVEGAKLRMAANVNM